MIKHPDYPIRHGVPAMDRCVCGGVRHWHAPAPHGCDDCPCEDFELDENWRPPMTGAISKEAALHAASSAIMQPWDWHGNEYDLTLWNAGAKAAYDAVSSLPLVVADPEPTDALNELVAWRDRVLDIFRSHDLSGPATVEVLNIIIRKLQSAARADSKEPPAGAPVVAPEPTAEQRGERPCKCGHAMSFHRHYDDLLQMECGANPDCGHFSCRFPWTPTDFAPRPACDCKNWRAPVEPVPTLNDSKDLTVEPVPAPEAKTNDGHSLRVTVENDYLTAKFTCTAPVGSMCRLECPEGCEMVPCRHEPVDGGTCHAKEWFEAVDWLEVHESTGHESVLYDGPVNAFWDGDEFQWQIDAGPVVAGELTPCPTNHITVRRSSSYDLDAHMDDEGDFWRYNTFCPDCGTSLESAPVEGREEK